MTAPIPILDRFTEEQINDMICLYNAGKTQKEIGDEYGLPRRSVMKIFDKIGIHKNHSAAQKSRFDPAFVEAVLKYRSEGRGIEDIALLTKRSTSAAHRVLQKNGDNKPEQKQEIDINEIINAYRSGQAINKISTKMGISSIKISNILKENGVALREPAVYGGGSKPQEVNLPEFEDNEFWWINAYASYGVPTLAKFTNSTRHWVRKRLRDLEINKMTLSERMSKLDHQSVISDYEELGSMSLVAKKYGCTIQAIKDHLLKDGIVPRTSSEIFSGTGNPFYGKSHPQEVVDHCREIGSAAGIKFWQDNPEYVEVVVQKNKEIWSDVTKRREASKRISELRRQGKCGSSKGTVSSRFGDIAFDSSYECALIEWCEKDSRIVHLERDFMLIDYEHNGDRHFVPDFKIWLNNGSFLIVEVKSKWYAKQPKEQAKISAAFGLLADNFMVVENSFEKIAERINYTLEPADFEFESVELGWIEPSEYDNFYATFHYLGRTGRHGRTLAAKLGGRIIGAVSFSSLSRNESAERLGLSPSNVRELSRFCIHPDFQKKNFGSWFLSRAVKSYLKENGEIQALITFADTTVGHTGTIYKAANWISDGETKPSYRYSDKHGNNVHKKTVYDQARAVGMREREWADSQGLVRVREESKIRFIYRNQQK